MTTVLHRVRGLVERLAPVPLCDDCIADRLALGAGEQAGQYTRELAGTDGFERIIDTCSLCAADQPVICKRAR